MDYRYQNGELGFDAVHVCDCTLCKVETEWQAVRFGPSTAKEYAQSEFIWKIYGPIIENSLQTQSTLLRLMQNGNR